MYKMDSDGQGKRYMAILAGIVFSVLGICLLINIILDPLWHFEGNLITHENYGFNERQSKVNRFLKNWDQYNCLIFGSSRTTLLNETLINNYDCFNFSFSRGVIEEFLEFGMYIKNLGLNPKLIILGVDDINFVESGFPLSIPDFIQNRKSPPLFFEVYLTSDALRLSWRLLIHRPPGQRYYDKNFVGQILPTAPTYQPILKKRNAIIPKRESVILYRKFRDLFGGSEFIGYVPPISAWKIASKSEEELSNYLASIYEISGFISPMYDFSLVSDITRNPQNTHDGSHFSTLINKLIIDRFNGESGGFGIRVDSFEEKDEYIRKFRQSVDKFSASLVED